MPCAQWLDACDPHQQSFYLSCQAFSLLSYAALEQPSHSVKRLWINQNIYYLVMSQIPPQNINSWSLDTHCASCTRPPQKDHAGGPTQCSSMDDRKVEKRVEVNDHSTAPPFPHSSTKTHWPGCIQVGMDAPQSLVHKGGKIQHVHAQMGTIAQCELWVWHGGTNSRPHLVDLPHVAATAWTMWSGRIGLVDEEVAAQRLAGHLVWRYCIRKKKIIYRMSTHTQIADLNTP